MESPCAPDDASCVARGVAAAAAAAAALRCERICELLVPFTVSIATTSAMDGLSAGDCCTQRRPTCTHLSSRRRISGPGWPTAESRRSSLILFWLQDSRAYRRCSENSALQFMDKRGHLALASCTNSRPVEYSCLLTSEMSVWLLLFLWPLTISIRTTPKLYTSHFSVRLGPRAVYSGALYPLLAV